MNENSAQRHRDSPTTFALVNFVFIVDVKAASLECVIKLFVHHPAQFAWTKPLLDCVRCKNTANTSVGGCEGPVPSILAPSSEQYHGQISRPDRRPGCDVTDHVMPETVGVLRRHRQCCRDSRWSSSSFFQLMLYGETRVYSVY